MRFPDFIMISELGFMGRFFFFWSDRTIFGVIAQLVFQRFQSLAFFFCVFFGIADLQFGISFALLLFLDYGY